MEKITAFFKEGVTERELASKFDDISGPLGSEGTSFPTILCFGKNAALPHHFPDNTRLNSGDIILIDAGAKVDNYCSDISRTFIFGNKSKTKDYERKKEIYEIVKNAQQAAINQLRPGRRAKTSTRSRGTT